MPFKGATPVPSPRADADGGGCEKIRKLRNYPASGGVAIISFVSGIAAGTACAL